MNDGDALNLAWSSCFSMSSARESMVAASSASATAICKAPFRTSWENSQGDHRPMCATAETYSQALKSLHSCFRVRIPLSTERKEGVAAGSLQSCCLRFERRSRESYETNHSVNHFKRLRLEHRSHRAIKQFIPSGIPSAYALHSASERAMEQIIPSGISSVYALNNGPERAMKQIIPFGISSAYAFNSGSERAMKQIIPSGISCA